MYLYVLAFLNWILVRSNGACRGKMSNCTGQNVRGPSTWKANYHIGSKPCYHARTLWLENSINICVFRIQASILRLKGKDWTGTRSLRQHTNRQMAAEWDLAMLSDTWQFYGSVQKHRHIVHQNTTKWRTWKHQLTENKCTDIGRLHLTPEVSFWRLPSQRDEVIWIWTETVKNDNLIQ